MQVPIELFPQRKKAKVFSSYFSKFLLLFLLGGLIMPKPVHGFWPLDIFTIKPPAELPEPGPIKPMVPVVENQPGEFEEKVAMMAADLFNNLQEPDPEDGALAEGLMVCTFVDLKKLYRTSSFGRYLAEQLMGEFQRRNYKVIDIRKSEAVLVQEKRGEYGLSRDPAEINDKAAAGAMLTGTYTPAGSHILVNARILDNRDSSVLSSSTFIFPKDALATLLLSDSASASGVNKGGPIYMKKLEL